MKAENTMRQAPAEENSPIDLEQLDLEEAKEVLHSFGKAYSALKIYPFDNPAVQNSLNVFSERMMGFLNRHEELRIEVQEFSLSFKGEGFFIEGERKKNLPFLLYRDGMRELSFHEGLTKKEVEDFLKTIKLNTELPEDECDIINSLWEKDFTHIRYTALDEFLDTQIGGQGDGDEPAVNSEELFEGTIKLSREDREDIARHRQPLTSDPGDGPKKESGAGSSLHEDLVFQAAALSEKDIPEIESMVSEDRERSSIRELIILLFEILFLEERQDHFEETLNVLEKHLWEAVQIPDFSQAHHILSQIIDLRAAVPDLSKDKVSALDRIFEKAKKKGAIKELGKIYFSGLVIDFDSFLGYLQLLFPESIPLVIDIWDQSKNPENKEKISRLLQKIGADNIDYLVDIAEQSCEPLVKEILSILGKTDNNRSLPYLEKFVHHRDKSIRLETLHALKHARSEEGDKILIDLLFDKEEEIRIKAAMSLNFSGNRTALNTIKKIVSKNGFRKRSRSEKKAFFDCLARSPDEEVTFLFHSLLKKQNFLFSKAGDVTRLCVVSALETMATPEAVNILKEGTYLRHKRIRKACRLALRKLSARHRQYREIEVV